MNNCTDGARHERRSIDTPERSLGSAAACRTQGGVWRWVFGRLADVRGKHVAFIKGPPFQSRPHHELPAATYYVPCSRGQDKTPKSAQRLVYLEDLDIFSILRKIVSFRKRMKSTIRAPLS